MILIAGGDSMIWGSELADSPHGGKNGYSFRTFTALLTDEETEYICAAYPGSSNADIAQNVRDAINSNQGPLFVIVCWTWPSRDKILTSKRVIQQLGEYLNYHQIPHLFTCVDNCLFDVIDKNNLNMENWYLFPPAVEEYNTTTPRGFYQWAIENKYKVGPDGHPLEAAHVDAAIMIKEKFNEMVKKHYQLG